MITEVHILSGFRGEDIDRSSSKKTRTSAILVKSVNIQFSEKNGPNVTTHQAQRRVSVLQVMKLIEVRPKQPGCVILVFYC